MRIPFLARSFALILTLAFVVTTAGCSSMARMLISTENGEKNWIIVEGVTRDGATLTFSEVQIEANGWLVMHPFENGEPNGKVYVGASYVEAGNNRDVSITLDEEPNKGDMFIVMLHSDVNENKEFDFVFVDSVSVLDKAVFEGLTMIGHAIPAP